jgi:hypothetical protein
MMAPSNQRQVEVLSEISDIIVKLSNEDLEPMGSLAEQITSSDPELGDRLLEAYALLIQLNDDVKSALEPLEPDTEDMEEERDVAIVEIEVDEADTEDRQHTGREQGKGCPKQQK